MSHDDLAEMFGPTAAFGMREGHPDCEDNGWYCVEASDNGESSTPSIAIYFQTQSQATAFAAAIDQSDKLGEKNRSSRCFKYIWLSVFGTWRTKTNVQREGWVYYWWSSGTSWGDPPRAGQGKPVKSGGDVQVNVVDYHPLAPA